jgi:prepilin-type N-terminal cleavage/methylation domain-containing protein
MASGVDTPRGCRGMTLVELMIVVSILGILAAIVIPKFSSASDEAEATHAAATLRLLRDAAQRYNAEHGDWPANVDRGVMPPELEPYFVGADMKNDVTGGKWDYENWIDRGRTLSDGRPIGIAFSLRGGDWSQIEEIDRLIDDGDVNTGNLQLYGKAFLYLVHSQ